jgi:SAM-dependent methyltransferase
VAPNGHVPDELALAGTEHLDPAYVASYDRKAAFDPAGDVAELEELGLDGAATLVDLGAGTGAFAVAAAGVCGRVVAVDVSPAMTAAIRVRVARLGLANVEVVEAGFLGYRHAGQPAAFVYTRNALHHLPDFWKAVALERIAGALRPGGILRLRDIVYACEPREAEEVVSGWLEDAVEHPQEGWTRAEREQHVREEFSTFSWLLEEMLERAGFDVERAEVSAGVHADYLCRKR